MPFDIIGFAEAAPGTGTPNIAAALNELYYSFSGDNIKVKKQAPFLLGAFASAESTGGRIRIKQPSKPLYIELIKSCLPTDNDPVQGWNDLLNRPIALKEEEDINVAIQNATDEDALIGLILGNGKITQASLDAAPSPDYILTGYADTTLTAVTWTSLTMTWDQTLPSGKYQILGMKAAVYKASAPGLALTRLVLSEAQAAPWHPGCIAAVMEGDKVEIQSLGWLPLEQWPDMKEIVFSDLKMPTIEMLSPYADTDERIELALKKVG